MMPAKELAKELKKTFGKRAIVKVAAVCDMASKDEQEDEAYWEEVLTEVRRLVNGGRQRA